MNPEIGHEDGPFALPGAPNPEGLLVLDPLTDLSGAVWAEPDDCSFVHLHGPFQNHNDPAPNLQSIRNRPAATAGWFISFDSIESDSMATEIFRGLIKRKNPFSDRPIVPLFTLKTDIPSRALHLEFEKKYDG